MKRPSAVKSFTWLRVRLWECGNPHWGFPHFHNLRSCRRPHLAEERPGGELRQSSIRVVGRRSSVAAQYAMRVGAWHHLCDGSHVRPRHKSCSRSRLSALAALCSPPRSTSRARWFAHENRCDPATTQIKSDSIDAPARQSRCAARGARRSPGPTYARRRRGHCGRAK